MERKIKVKKTILYPLFIVLSTYISFAGWFTVLTPPPSTGMLNINLSNITSTNISHLYDWNGSDWLGIRGNSQGVLQIEVIGASSNITYELNPDYNSTEEMITAVNSTGYLINWSQFVSLSNDDVTFNITRNANSIADLIKNLTTINLTFNNFIATLNNTLGKNYNTTEEIIIAVNSTGYLINWSQFASDSHLYDWNGSDWLGIKGNNEGVLQIEVIGVISNTSSESNTNYNSTEEMIKAVNSTGYLINWSGQLSTSTSGLFANWSSADYVGSDFTGVSGSSFRNITVSADVVDVDNLFLHPNTDYNVTNGMLTLFNPLWDDMRVTLWFSTGLNYTNLLGSAFSGVNGNVGRGWLTSNMTFVVVDNLLLHPNTDYHFSNGNLSLNNPLWDDMRVTIWY